MAGVPEVNNRCCRWLRQLGVRGSLLLFLTVALGLFFWWLERDWYSGALAAICPWFVFGLAAQVRDLCRHPQRNDALTSEQRWAWRFAVAWRIVIACLMVAYFVVELLIRWHVLTLNDGRGFTNFAVVGMYPAILLISMIAAVASSPWLAQRADRRSWSWAVELLGGIAACVLVAILAMDYVFIQVLVHITIAFIELAQPLRFASEELAAYSPARFAWFFNITTAGVASVLISCILLRLLSVCWWRGVRWRISLGVLLVASLATTIMLSKRIALVEVPDITGALAAEIRMPGPYQMVIGGVLAMLLVGAAARRWSERPPIAHATGNLAWRRDEDRYYHERRIVLSLLAGVLLLWLVRMNIGWSWEIVRCNLAGWMHYPPTCLSVALIILIAQSEFSRKRKCSDAALVELPSLSPGLFLVVWTALLAIVVFAAPILGAWGFALWFNRG